MPKPLELYSIHSNSNKYFSIALRAKIDPIFTSEYTRVYTIHVVYL